MSADAAQPLFAPVDLRPYLTAGRQAAPGVWQAATMGALAELPGGTQRFWGMPFELAPAPSSEFPVLGSESGGSPVNPEPGSRSPEPAWLLLGEAAGQPAAATIRPRTPNVERPTPNA